MSGFEVSAADLAGEWPLQCPNCRARLPQASSCTRCGCKYEIVGGKPILIAFDSSLVTREAIMNNSPENDLDGATSIGRFLQGLSYNASSDLLLCFSNMLDEVLIRDSDSEFRLLIVGGGTKGPGEDLLDSKPRLRVLRTDIYLGRDVDIVCDGHDLPFPDNTFDAVLCQAVLEHVLEPQRVVDEIHRVLCTGGIVGAGTPFLQSVHMAAYDFTRFTLSGHRWLFRKFEEVNAGIRGGPGLSAIWSLGTLVRGLGMGPRLASVFTACFSWLRWLDRFVSPKYLEDGANGVWFVGTKRSTSMQPIEIITYYDRRTSTPQQKTG